MRRIITITLAILFLLTMFSGCTTTHKAICEVVEVKHGIVTVVDRHGEEWEFYSDANWFIGELVEITFDRKPEPSNFHEVEIINARLAY